MQGKIYLHVGTHKTGTTSLQDSLARHRAHLNALGVLYPRLQPYFSQRTTGHHAFAHALASYNLRERAKLWGLRRTIDAQMRGKRFGILSAEALYRHTVGFKPHASVDAWFDAHKRYLDRVATYLEGYEVQPVIYFRHPEDFIVSLYKEGVAIRNEALFTSLKEFVKLRLPRLDYQRHVAVLRDSFGSVCVRSYETARKAGILFDFAEVIGLSSQEIASLGPADTIARSSICNKALRWLQEAERLGGPSTHNRRLQFALRKHDTGPFANSSESMLWERPEDRHAFITQFDPNCEWSATNSGDVEPINWSQADQAEANSAFIKWESENQAVLSRREQMKLKFYEPDPDCAQGP